jgi:hypothetical protein
VTGSLRAENAEVSWRSQPETRRMSRWLVLLLVLVGLFCAVFPILLIGDRGGGTTRMLFAISAAAVSLAALGLLSPQWPPAFWSWLRLDPRSDVPAVAAIAAPMSGNKEECQAMATLRTRLLG